MNAPKGTTSSTSRDMNNAAPAAKVSARCSHGKRYGMTGGWWTVIISATNLEGELTFFDTGNMEDSLLGISNALHSAGFLLVSHWTAKGQDFHASAVEVELSAAPEWAASTRDVSSRAWSPAFLEENKGAGHRIHELELLPWSETLDNTVTITQSDVFQRGTVQRTAARLNVNINETNMSPVRAAAIAAALENAAEIISQSADAAQN